LNEAAKLRKQIDKSTEKYPENGTIARFRMFVEAGPIEGYLFAAVFVRERWYLSGTLDYVRDVRVMTPEQFLDNFARFPEKFRDLAIATDWEEV
jgi:hypothetical protein